ncbi:hypothetical protein MASR2M29_02690 [Spirochaetota bacterium]
MNPKTAEFKEAMLKVRERIASAKRCGTHRGFIDYHGCITVTDEFIAILDEAENSAESGEFIFTYTVAALILVNLAKLAGFADDSTGSITGAQGYVRDFLEKICCRVERGSPDAEVIFLQSLTDSQNKVFDDWGDYSYDLLLPAARLASAKNVNRLYATLDSLDTKLSRDEFTWHKEKDRLVRLEAIKATEGERAAEGFIADNIQYDSICRIAIRNSLEKGDFSLAEELCRGKIDSTDRGYHWTRQWYDMLFEVYTKSGNKEQQAELARELLIKECDTRYYAVLKQLLSEKGVWEEAYPSLLEKLARNLPSNLYMDILSIENETRLLFEQLKADPSMVFVYGKQLYAEFPAEIRAICSDEIRQQAAKANNRSRYRQVCGYIKNLHSYGGKTDLGSIIDQLKAEYPRRPAFIDELDKLGAWLAKKKK